MTDKKRVETIDLENYAGTSPVEKVVVSLLTFYINYNGDELKISPSMKRQEDKDKYDWGIYCQKDNTADLMTPPPNNVIPEIFSYIRKRTGLEEKPLKQTILNYQEGTLLVSHKDGKYRIPFSIRFNEHYQKEEITFGKPEKLEQKV